MSWCAVRSLQLERTCVMVCSKVTPTGAYDVSWCAVRSLQLERTCIMVCSKAHAVTKQNIWNKIGTMRCEVKLRVSVASRPRKPISIYGSVTNISPND